MEEKKLNSILSSTLKEIEKKFGKEAIMLLGNKPDTEYETFSSGSIAIDNALGINGWPKGRVIEIFGPESSGKTTLSLHAIAEVQKQDGIAAFIDAEHSIDTAYAKALGVDISNLILSQPDSGEQALEIADMLIKTGSVDLIVVDSVAALVPEAELNGEMKDQTIGSQARLMSKALRKITASLAKHKTTIIFINQIREKVGIIFGNPETTPGGKALKFYSSIRAEVRKVQNITENNEISGNLIKVKIVKNKLSAPYKVANVEIVFGYGIDKITEIIDLAEQNKILDKKASWYAYKGENIAQGRTKLREYLIKNENIYEEIKNQVIEIQKSK
ncbi:recombinase RecA [[Mycoplasma] gypis]|uniref:Protein RecA n=1 Tax=[Mycoplasma] gypis TaxID=92404 RepID=A0ABZ2RM88_9BACT|nr:recombinase RecA [[Mycoplasma] gypis]MBN0919158.1 recombinase RecA [[Mycoplasma] gypis]